MNHAANQSIDSHVFIYTVTIPATEAVFLTSKWIYRPKLLIMTN